MAQVELADDVLHMRAESVQIGLEVLAQARVVRFRAQHLHGEGRRVVERIASELTELLLLTLFGHHLKLFGPTEVQHRFLRRLQQEVESAQHNERQRNFFVISFFEGLHKHIVGDVEQEGEQAAVLSLVHIVYFNFQVL